MIDWQNSSVGDLCKLVQVLVLGQFKIATYSMARVSPKRRSHGNSSKQYGHGSQDGGLHVERVQNIS